MGDNLTREESALLDGVTAFISEVQVLRARLHNVETWQAEQVKDRLLGFDGAGKPLVGSLSDVANMRQELQELRTENTGMRKAAEWPTPQPIGTAPCATVVLVYDTEDQSWIKLYTRHTKPAVSQNKERYPVWLPLPPPPGGA